MGKGHSASRQVSVDVVDYLLVGHLDYDNGLINSVMLRATPLSGNSFHVVMATDKLVLEIGKEDGNNMRAVPSYSVYVLVDFAHFPLGNSNVSENLEAIYLILADFRWLD